MPTSSQQDLAEAAMGLYNEGSVSGAVRLLETMGPMAPSLAVTALRLGVDAVASALEEAQSLPEGSPRLRDSLDVARRAREARARDARATLENITEEMRRHGITVDRDAVDRLNFDARMTVTGRLPTGPEIQRMPHRGALQAPNMFSRAAADAADRAERLAVASTIAAPNLNGDVFHSEDARFPDLDAMTRAAEEAVPRGTLPVGTRAVTPQGLAYTLTRNGWEAIPVHRAPPKPKAPDPKARTLYEHLLDED